MPPQRRATVWVIDDDDATARTVARVLPDCEVRAFSSAAAAIRALPDGCDLVLCDVHLRHDDARDLVESVRVREPSLLGRILIVTGDAGSPGARALAGQGLRIMEKPLSLDGLRRIAATLREALRTRSLEPGLARLSPGTY